MLTVASVSLRFIKGTSSSKKHKNTNEESRFQQVNNENVAEVNRMVFEHRMKRKFSTVHMCVVNNYILNFHEHLLTHNLCGDYCQNVMKVLITIYPEKFS